VMPLILSGRTEAALRAQAAALRAHLGTHPELALGDVAYSLVTTRARLEQGAAVVAGDRPGVMAALEALAEGLSAAGTVLGRRAAEGKVVFVFPGQGSQWPAMARALIDSSPVFCEQLQACERAFARPVDWSL